MPSSERLDQMNAFIASQPPLSTGKPMPRAEEFFMAMREVFFVMEGPIPGTMQPGEFRTQLIRAAMHADMSNLAALAAGFPALGAVVMLYKHVPTGRDIMARWLEDES